MLSIERKKKMSIFERWRLKQNPYTTSPIDKENLDLFVGRKNKVKRAGNVISEKSIVIVEGKRGVGTTSFGNYIRFQKELKGKNLTPVRELSVGNGWNEEILIANVLSSLTWELEGKIPDKYKDRYNEIKLIAHQIRETYRNISLQLSVVGTGGGIGINKQTNVIMPQLYPTATLIQHLLEIKKLVEVSGFNKDTIIQLNNLDIDVLFSSQQLILFLNDIRDILQIEGYTWILVGDSGLRSCISDKVDRLDDIISYDCIIEPLTLDEVYLTINKRLKKFAQKENYLKPLSDNLIEILYHATNGRIRQIFGFSTRLIHSVSDNLLIEQITTDIALPIIKREVEDKLRQNNITRREKMVLEEIAENPGISPSILSSKTSLSLPNLSRLLSHLLKARFVSFERAGRIRRYNVSSDVLIALTK